MLVSILIDSASQLVIPVVILRRAFTHFNVRTILEAAIITGKKTSSYKVCRLYNNINKKGKNIKITLTTLIAFSQYRQFFQLYR